ncbi:MAG: type II toxin-antitoxin system VapC family toxin [Hyphomicrobiales bacterium]|nr:type II toxin-antitoxin system VapC family toxin [Hyphomicrobiales bacterium]MCP5371830.1 type II toxin-antitoxin system VapC family toxin [Hyphomicrobiales bacterium]
MSVVLDASAVLAVLFAEPGHERVLPHLTGAGTDAGARLSAVNLGEVLTYFVRTGQAAEAARQAVRDLGIRCDPFDDEQARLTAALYPMGRPHGLSFGDRACLALGATLGLPVLTSDRAWARVDAGVEVEVIR